MRTLLLLLIAITCLEMTGCARYKLMTHADADPMQINDFVSSS
jgi:hypothetical protein